MAQIPTRTIIPKDPQREEHVSDHNELARLHNELDTANVVTTLGNKVDKGSLVTNVKDYGAIGDGVADDTAAFNSAVAAAGGAGGGIIFFPEGTYFTTNAEGFSVRDTNNISIRGVGRSSVLKRGAASRVNTVCLRLENCNDVTVSDLAFDTNNIDRYGGIYIINCDTFRFFNNYLFDSNLDPSWVDFDHYGLVVQESDDVWVVNNKAVDIELLEANNCRRVRCLDNTVVRAAGTLAIGMSTVSAGKYAYEFEYRNNLIIDPRKDAISFQQEASGLTNGIVKGIRIEGNTIVRDTIAGTGRSIFCGTGAGGAASGNVWEDISIIGNRIWVNAALVRDREEIAMRHSQTGRVFTRCQVRGNEIRNLGGTGEWCMNLQKLLDSEVTGNIIEGGAFGLVISEAENTGATDNRVKATNTAYQLATSSGNNRLIGNRITNAPTTRWNTGGIHASDITETERFYATATFDPPSLASGGQQTLGDVTVTGAALGDFVEVSHSVSLISTHIWGEVISANTVRVFQSNLSGAARDVTSGTTRIIVTRTKP